MGFSEKLQKIRKEKSLTQEQFAELTGVTRQSVSKWESGEAYPETERLIQIAAVLQCSLDYLFEDEIYSCRGNSSDEPANVEEAVYKIFPDIKSDKHRSRGKFRWNEENIRRALSYLEKTKYGCRSARSVKECQENSVIIVFRGKMYRMIIPSDKRNERKNRILEIKNDELIEYLTRLKWNREFDKVEFTYDT